MNSVQVSTPSTPSTPTGQRGGPSAASGPAGPAPGAWLRRAAAAALLLALGCGGAGGLDPSFGQGGRVVTQMGGGDDSAEALAVQPDGRVVLAGQARPDRQSLLGFALARFLPEGGLDPSFGDGGRVLTAFDERFPSGALAVARQADGKLVAAGFARHPQVLHDGVALVRYNPDGTLDEGFGGGGGVLTAVDPETGAGRGDVARAVAIDGAGRILVTGETGGAFKDVFVLRYLPDGRLDPSFGDGGGVTTDLGGTDVGRALAVQPDGKILVGGSGHRGNEDFALLRYAADGALDRGFGDGGVVRTDLRGGADRAQAIALLPGGGVVLGGVAQLAGGCQAHACERYGFALARYTAAGQLDGAFGDGGKVLPDFLSWAGAYGMARLPDGRLALAGHIGNEDFAVALFQPDGRLDGRFGDRGLLRAPIGAGVDRATAAGVLPDGSFVAGGTAMSADGSDADFALARFRAP